MRVGSSVLFWGKQLPYVPWHNLLMRAVRVNKDNKAVKIQNKGLKNAEMSL